MAGPERHYGTLHLPGISDVKSVGIRVKRLDVRPERQDILKSHAQLTLSTGNKNTSHIARKISKFPRELQEWEQSGTVGSTQVKLIGMVFLVVCGQGAEEFTNLSCRLLCLRAHFLTLQAQQQYTIESVQAGFYFARTALRS